MSRPVVAIVGRPNVGKSTLFNALAGDKISIVQDTPGVTRDRIYADVSWLNYNFTIICIKIQEKPAFWQQKRTVIITVLFAIYLPSSVSS